MLYFADTNESPEQECLSVKEGDRNQDSDISDRSQSTSSESVRDIHLHTNKKQRTKYDPVQVKHLVHFENLKRTQ